MIAEQARERDPALSPIEDVSPSLEMEEAGEHNVHKHNHKQVGSMIHHNQHHLSQHALRVKENDLGQEKGYNDQPNPSNPTHSNNL